jgi:hypothetical protein
MTELRVAGQTVAEYVLEPDIDLTLSPRPYLHPVRTLGGVTVTDVFPEDHRWHLGVSLAVQDVSGTNIWGGRTYVRDSGYTWLEDHGRIAHDGWVESTDSRLAHRLRWLDPAGGTLLTEERVIEAAPAPQGWTLDFGFVLTAPEGRDMAVSSGGFRRVRPMSSRPLWTVRKRRTAASSHGWRCVVPGTRWSFRGSRTPTAGSSG